MSMPIHLRESERLLHQGFKLVRLHDYEKRPVGEGWNDPANVAKKIDPRATGYGLPLALNNLCSVDPDHLEYARIGLAACGWDLEKIMAAGVRTKSTRPNSGGRSAFVTDDRLSWVTFGVDVGGKKVTALELRADSDNLQDCVPGVMYRDNAGNDCTQSYTNGRRLDEAGDLPAAFADWWARLSIDGEFLHAQQTLFSNACGGGAVLSLPSKLGATLPYSSPLRVPFNAAVSVQALLDRNGYRWDAKTQRYSAPDATGGPGVRLIPGKDGLWRSSHGSDPLRGTFDAWVAFVVLENGYNLESAEAAARELVREAQRQENEAIQQVAFDPLPLVMTAREMRARLVFVEDGSQVCLIDNPRRAMSLADAKNTFAASTESFDNGKKVVPAINLWLKDSGRMTVARRTFMPGEDSFCTGPEGHPSINTWRDFERSPVPNAGLAVGVFVEHLTYMIPDETERGVFLDWLAHIEQRPGVLPHYGWLHIARHTGTGRNWLASVLARVWRGNCAPNIDLPSLLDGQFNGRLSESLIAVVDEIQEGGDSGYRHINRLKSLLNAETREINPKYGRTILEKNCCRWLVFSNHENAIPMNDTDRRWRVVVHTTEPRPPADYERMYSALSDPAFIDAVAYFLRQRDISRFKPGERPPMTAGKLAVIDASKSALRRAADQLVEEWNSDLITATEANAYLEEFGSKVQGNAARYAMVEAGAMPLRKSDGLERKTRIGTKTYRVWSLRNHAKWTSASADDVRSEVLKGAKTSFF